MSSNTKCRERPMALSHTHIPVLGNPDIAKKVVPVDAGIG